MLKFLLKTLPPSFIKQFLIKLGRFYERNSKRFPSQEGSFHTLKALGWNPKKCIDIGAYHGEWTEMFLSIFPETSVLMIEAQESKASILAEIVLKHKKLSYEIALLGATNQKKVVFVEMETGSSVFEELSHYPRKRVVKSLTTLDSLVQNLPQFADSSILKIDTQGYEMEVLKGSLSLLKNLEIIILEVSLLSINSGAPLFSDIVYFMTQHHFKLFDFCSQIRRKDGVLWQTDLLFVSESAGLNIEPRLTKENWGN